MFSTFHEIWRSGHFKISFNTVTNLIKALKNVKTLKSLAFFHRSTVKHLKHQSDLNIGGVEWVTCTFAMNLSGDLLWIWRTSRNRMKLGRDSCINQTALKGLSSWYHWMTMYDFERYDLDFLLLIWSFSKWKSEHCSEATIHRICELLIFAGNLS